MSEDANNVLISGGSFTQFDHKFVQPEARRIDTYVPPHIVLRYDLNRFPKRFITYGEKSLLVLFMIPRSDRIYWK